MLVYSSESRVISVRLSSMSKFVMRYLDYAWKFISLSLLLHILQTFHQVEADAVALGFGGGGR